MQTIKQLKELEAERKEAKAENRPHTGIVIDHQNTLSVYATMLLYKLMHPTDKVRRWTMVQSDGQAIYAGFANWEGTAQ